MEFAAIRDLSLSNLRPFSSVLLCAVSTAFLLVIRRNFTDSETITLFKIYIIGV
jgi:hypothetical protein